MTIAYSVNSGSEIHGVDSTWLRQPIRRSVDGTLTYSDWAINTWRLATMTMTEFESLVLLRGATLTSVITTDIDTRNTQKNYTTAILEGVVNGQQVGRIVENVQITFRIDVS